MTLAPRSELLSLDGPVGRLEARLEQPGDAPSAVAVVCHPHPLYRGTMQNKVVTTLARAFLHVGAASLRFNFRGVGESAGQYDGSSGELDDLLAAIDWLRAEWPGLPLLLAGFSFGGAIAVRAASLRPTRSLVTIAPAVDRVPSNQARPDCDWLIVHGDSDDVVAADRVRSWASAFAPPPEIIMLAGAGHFFHGRLIELRDAVETFVGTIE